MGKLAGSLVLIAATAVGCTKAGPSPAAPVPVVPTADGRWSDGTHTLAFFDGGYTFQITTCDGSPCGKCAGTSSLGAWPSPDGGVVHDDRHFGIRVEPGPVLVVASDDGDDTWRLAPVPPPDLTGTWDADAYRLELSAGGYAVACHPDADGCVPETGTWTLVPGSADQVHFTHGAVTDRFEINVFEDDYLRLVELGDGDRTHQLRRRR